MKFTIKSFSYYLGNFSIIASLLCLLYIYFPVIQTYLFPQKVVASSDKGMSVSIPKIHALAPIIENVNPWDEDEYKAALKKGVAHAKGFSLPGDPGLSFLFAHSSGLPWEGTRYNTVFLRLGELEKGDSILITRGGKEYTYIVQEKKEVWPQEVGFLLRTNKTMLILQTCTPIGTSLKRLLIFAYPK